MIRVGVAGARGHVGAELLPILLRHPEVELAWVTSTTAAGTAVPGSQLNYRDANPRISSDEPVDALFLALPNGEADAWADSVSDAMTVIDLSADHRFDPTWVYAQADRYAEIIPGKKRLSCPGCYATAAQLAIAPLVDRLAGAITIFGVSGFSGAGTTKSEKNDVSALAENILPYSLVGHPHERELRRHLGRRVHFMPHVASFFRGLVVTISAELVRPTAAVVLREAIANAYRGSPFVEVVEAPPRPRDSVGKHGVRIGGVSVDEDGGHVVVVAALDNLLGGAASQAVRAMNLSFGHDQALGLFA